MAPSLRRKWAWDVHTCVAYELFAYSNVDISEHEMQLLPREGMESAEGEQATSKEMRKPSEGG